MCLLLVCIVSLLLWFDAFTCFLLYVDLLVWGCFTVVFAMIALLLVWLLSVLFLIVDEWCCLGCMFGL